MAATRNPCRGVLGAHLQYSSVRLHEIVNPDRFPPKKLFHYAGWKIASLDPDYFGRRSETFGQSNEVTVGADQRGKLESSSPIENKRVG